MNCFRCSTGSLQNYSIIALSFLRNYGKNITPQPASLLLPLPPPAHVRGKRPVNPYIGVLAQKDACMTTKIYILKRRSGGSMAYVVTFGRPMATGRRRPEKRRREGNECSYCLGSPSGLNKCAASRVPAGAQIVTYVSA